MRPSALALLILLPAGSFLAGCEGGTSSETVGMVEAAPGRAAITGKTEAGVSLGLYADDFLPQSDSGFSATATADSAGRFAFSDLEPGRYRLLARRLSDGAAALVPDLVIPGEGGPAPAGKLEPTATLRGTITDSLSASTGIVYVPGTPFFAVADSLMRYSLAGLPAGSFRIVKSWKMPIPCEAGRACGGFENRADTVEVRIRPGENVVR